MTDETQTQTSEPAAETPAPETPSVEAQLAAAQAEIKRLQEEALRHLAEADNIRKRGERALQEARTFAIDRFARDMLAVADNLGRALDAAPADGSGDPAALREGVAMTAQALDDIFARHGVRRVGAKGERFDPNLHQAVAQIPSEAPAGTIAEVLQPGYVLAERTLRAAMVAVSAGQPAAPPQEPPSAAGDAGASVDIKV